MIPCPTYYQLDCLRTSLTDLEHSITMSLCDIILNMISAVRDSCVTCTQGVVSLGIFCGRKNLDNIHRWGMVWWGVAISGELI